MPKTKAHALLDAAKAGADVPEEQITEALIITGDIGRTRPNSLNVDNYMLYKHMWLAEYEKLYKKNTKTT